MKSLFKIEFKSNHILHVGFRVILSALILCGFAPISNAQTGSTKVVVPDWALPGSATHKQVPPPLNFHRETKTENTKIGVFEGQSDVGAALVPGTSAYNKKTKQYTITSAGYNIWYTRDEFLYLWKKMSGDVSLAADVNFPDKEGYDDRKVVLVIRQSLNDDSKEAMIGIHGGGLIHLAYRPENNAEMKEMRVDKRSALRLGIEKQGDSFTIFLSMNGEPMKQYGEPLKLKIDEPFYVGVGLCSHIPDQTTTAVISNVVLENIAGKVK
jgi:hypothetical protein